MQEEEKKGYFGAFGGRFVPESLMGALEELEEHYLAVREDDSFQQDLIHALQKYVGRPSLLTYCDNLTHKIGGGKIYLKREDLNHTGAHKINNAMGQALLAKRMGKNRIIAETGAGQHGVATATACSIFGLECEVYMGETDVKRQALNVFQMELMGAKVNPVKTGSKTLKEAVTEAIRDWVTNVEDSYYLIGSVVGPHPYPLMVRDFQKVIGEETKEQFFNKEGCFPDKVIACVGGGSNAMGMFYPFLDTDTELYGVEAGGTGASVGEHAAPLSLGSPGILHGAKSYLLQDDWGQVSPVHSISAGLDYPGVGPEHSYLKDNSRVTYVSVTDDEALSAFKLLARTEGIVPALESSHALSYAYKLAKDMTTDSSIIVNLSGRGDKDVNEVRKCL